MNPIIEFIDIIARLIMHALGRLVFFGICLAGLVWLFSFTDRQLGIDPAWIFIALAVIGLIGQIFLPPEEEDRRESD